MKNLPQPIFFTPIDSCDADPGYCQVIDPSDTPKFRLSKLCDTELLGTTEKLPCEQYEVISNLSDIFQTLDGMVADDVIVGSNDVAGTHSAKTQAGYLTAGTGYVISYQIKNLTKGSVKVKAGDGTGSENIGNGFYTDVILTGAGTILEIIGTDDGEDVFDGEVSNIVIQCIRYSKLFELSWDGGGGSPFSFYGQTKICKTAGVAGYITKLLPDITPGKTYKLSFRVSGNTSTDPLLYGLWIATLGDIVPTPSTNGYYELYVVAGDGNAYEGMYMKLPADFDGCIQDITTYEVADIRVGVFNADGTENDCADVELINDYSYPDTQGDSSVLALYPNENCGCIKIGYADSCSDYLGQFSGKSQMIGVVPTTGAGTNFIDPDTGNFDIVSEDGGEFSPYLIYSGIIAPGLNYCGVIKVKGGSGEFPINLLRVTVIIGGTTYELGDVDEPATNTYYDFDIVDLLAGTVNSDLKIIVTYMTSENTTGQINLDTSDVHLCAGQFIPDHFSNCFNILTKAQCDNTLIVKYSNSKPLFGLTYDSALPEYSFRFAAKTWHPKFPKTREINRDSLGHKTVNYSDIEKYFLLNIEPLPAYLLEALCVALDHDSLEIGPDAANMITYVSETDEFSPTWNKNSELAPVEVTLSVQNTRVVKSYC